MGFAKEAASFLLFKMFPFTYVLLLSLFWMFLICDIAIDLFWSEIIGFISVEQTSGLSKWIIINFFFFTFFLRRPTTGTALWEVHYTLSLQDHQKSFCFCVMLSVIIYCVSAVYNDQAN